MHKEIGPWQFPCPTPITLKNAQRQFENALPRSAQSQIALPPLASMTPCRGTDNALVACWLAWIGIMRRGQDPIVVGVAGITYNASRYDNASRLTRS